MYLPTAVSPATEFKITSLIIKRKPCNVYLACAFKDAWRDIETATVVGDDDVSLERSVEFFVGAVAEKKEDQR
jgi:hypothetical protein